MKEHELRTRARLPGNGHSIEATGYVMPDFVASEIHRVTTADGLPLIAACTTTTRPAVARALK